MANIWSFSPESKSLLQRCLNAAAPPDESNKWLQKFGPRNLDLIKDFEDTIVVNDSPDTTHSPIVQDKQDEDILIVVQEFLDPDFDLVLRFDYFVNKCIKTPKLLTNLAQNLPTNTVERLFQHIFDSNDLNNQFLEYFYVNFLHTYIKRDNSRFCTNALLKIYNKYPQYLKLALKVILKDLEVKNNVVNNFISNLNANDQTEFLNLITDIEFTSEEFSHNLFNIYTAYKSCLKSDFLQNCMFLCLKKHSNFCCNDKNYGKLLLSFTI